MDVVRVGQIRKTGIVVKFECKMYGKETDEYLYVFGVKVRNIVYRCHYVTKDIVKIDVGDYVLFNGELTIERFGFAATCIVQVVVLTLLKKDDMANFNKDHILVVDYKMRGFNIKNNEQNGFILHKNNTIKKAKKLTKKYGVFYKLAVIDINHTKYEFIDDFEYIDEFKRLCIKKYARDEYDFNKMCVIDFEAKYIHSFMKFCKEAFNL